MTHATTPIDPRTRPQPRLPGALRCVYTGNALNLAVLLVLAAGALAACDRGSRGAAVPDAAPPPRSDMAAAPAPEPPALSTLPPPSRTQALGVVAALDDEGWITVVRAEATPAAGPRLLLAFQIVKPGWTSDAAPAAMRRIFLTDAWGRRAGLIEVTGSSAADDTASIALEGWYSFAPLAAGARHVTLTYPVYEDGSHPVQVAFDLGSASPALTPDSLAGVWRTALIAGPSAQIDARGSARQLWPYERVEFRPDGQVLLSGAGDARSSNGSFQSANGLRLSFSLADGVNLDYTIDEFTAERLVLARPGPAGAEWVVLTRQ